MGQTESTMRVPALAIGLVGALVLLSVEGVPLRGEDGVELVELVDAAANLGKKDATLQVLKKIASKKKAVANKLTAIAVHLRAKVNGHGKDVHLEALKKVAAHKSKVAVKLAKVAAVARAKANGMLNYADTLQSFSDKYCSTYKKKVGDGAIFCKMLVSLQDKWADAQELGETKNYMELLGTVTGHYCADKTDKSKTRCKIFKLMTSAVPTQMRWSPERKKYLKMTKDVSHHYCKKHGEKDIFCPLTKALAVHYHDAVNESEGKMYTGYLDKLSGHFCQKKVSEFHDDRCFIFPLLKKALPQMPTPPGR